MAGSVTVSSVDDAYMKGWNSEKAVSSAGSEAVSAGELITQPVLSATETEATSSVSSTASIPASAVGSSQASSAVASQEDFEQKWKSQHGIIRSQSQALSSAKSENDALRAAHSAPSSLAATAASSETDIDVLEEKYMDAWTEGDKAEALKIRREIDRIKEDRILARAGKEVQTVALSAATATLTAKDEESAVMHIVNRSYELYPYLDNQNQNADPNAIRFVRATAGEFMDDGKSKPEAISLAVSTAATLFAAVHPGRSAAVTAAETEADDSKLREMAAVGNRQVPVKTSQKKKGDGSFEDGWKSA